MAPSATTDDDRKGAQDDGPVDLAAAGDSIDMNTFEQVLEMDDDEDEREFSKSIVFDFFTQAESTFEKMDSSLDARDLSQLSSLGHFLKGSSATLGLNKVRDSCEKIQHYGQKKDETGSKDEPDTDKCLKSIRGCLEDARGEFHEVERLLRRFYHDEGS